MANSKKRVAEKESPMDMIAVARKSVEKAEASIDDGL